MNTMSKEFGHQMRYLNLRIPLAITYISTASNWLATETLGATTKENLKKMVADEAQQLSPSSYSAASLSFNDLAERLCLRSK